MPHFFGEGFADNPNHQVNIMEINKVKPGNFCWFELATSDQAAAKKFYGGLFGFFCYATFELTSLSLLKHWTWPVVMLDVSWGTFVTALSSTAGLSIANWLAPKISP